MFPSPMKATAPSAVPLRHRTGVEAIAAARRMTRPRPNMLLVWSKTDLCYIRLRSSIATRVAKNFLGNWAAGPSWTQVKQASNVSYELVQLHYPKVNSSAFYRKHAKRRVLVRTPRVRMILQQQVQGSIFDRMRAHDGG
jgi:hypothetical protein